MPKSTDAANGVIARRRKLSEYRHDPSNPNKGSERGREVLEDSLRTRGAGRSLLADADDMLIDGNQTLEAALALGYTDVIEVEIPPNTLLVGKRSDLDLDSPNDPRARELSIADNRATDFRDYDLDALQAAEQAGANLADFFDPGEFEEMIAAAEAEAQVNAAVDGGGSVSRGLTMDKARMIKPVLYADGVAVFEQALRATGLDNWGAALIAVCQAYLDEREREIVP